MSTQGCHCGHSPGACTTEFQYAAKLVCGVAADAPGKSSPVAPGRYWTAINIHNPDKCRNANFRWKVVVAKPLGEVPDVPLYQRIQVLGPDQAVEIDCDLINKTVPPPAPGFIKGYVVLESDVELDVVAVYSGGQSGCATLSAFHTERVPARQVAACEDLVLPLHTGLAGWQTVAPTVASPTPVALVSPLFSLWTTTPPFGARWVSQAMTDGTNASNGTRYYELCFELCSGFTPPAQFSIQVLADNSATVLLNNTVIGSVVNVGYLTPTTIAVNTGLLKTGRNCFRLAVTNTGQGTGFALSGMLRVARGKCPCSVLPMAPVATGPASADGGGTAIG